MDPLTVLGLILSALGALGAPSVIRSVWKKGSSVRHEMHRRRSSKASLTDFYVREIELACRIIEMDKRFFEVRTVNIVAMQDGVEGTRASFNPVHGREYHLSISPPDVSIVRIPPQQGRTEWLDYLLRFPHPLKRHESFAYTLTVDTTITSNIEHVWTFRSPNRRADKLTLRVVFPSPPPSRVCFKYWDIAGSELHSEELQLDPVTSEARKEVVDLNPTIRYGIVWDL